MALLEIEFNVICSCGADLSATEERKGVLQHIVVEPCEECLSQSYNEGMETAEQT